MALERSFYFTSLFLMFIISTPVTAQLNFNDGTQQNTAYTGTKATGTNSVIAGGAGNVASGSFSTVGGGQQNQALAAYTTIAGGGPSDSQIPWATSNLATDNGCTVGGGTNNTAGDNAGTYQDAVHATVAGGTNNIASNTAATVSGGEENTASGEHAVVAGGYSNDATGFISVVSGGINNDSSGDWGFVGGGALNEASYDYATVCGGAENVASGKNSFVGGGWRNNATGLDSTVSGGYGSTASGISATVAGGYSNVASGNYSFAAGRNVRATHTGAILFSDSTTTNFNSTIANEFAVRASGGVALYTNSSATTGATLAAGSGSWSSVSAREAKSDFEPVNATEILEKVATLPIETWRYKDQSEDIRHIGPMAEEFRTAFEVGDMEGRITNVDADGVALAAIQGLNAKLDEKEAEIKLLRTELDLYSKTTEELIERLEILERRLKDADNSSN